MEDLRPFLRTQSDSFLTSLQSTVAEAISQNTFHVSLQVAGKGVSQRRDIPVLKLAAQLADVLEERGLATSIASERMTIARFR